MAARGPGTGTWPVRALGPAVHALMTGRHEPDESRDSRPDLWGPRGEIPRGYPAGQQAAWPLRGHLVYVPRVRLQAPRGLRQNPGKIVHRFPAGSQRGEADGDEPKGASLEA